MKNFISSPCSTCFVLASIFVANAQAAAPKADSSTKTAAVEKSDKTTQAMLEDFQHAASRRKEFTVDFKQETYSAVRKRTTPQQGVLSFSAPRSFRWELTSPKKEVYVSNGKDFWKYTESTRHAQKLPAEAAELRFMDVFVKPGSLEKDFIVEEWVPNKAKSASKEQNDGGISDDPPPPAPGRILVKLVPKAPSKQKLMYLVVSKDQGTVDELRLVFESGNRSRIVFGKISEKPIEKSRFEFTPPPGTAVDQ